MRSLLLTGFAVLLVGCVGGISGDDGGGDDGMGDDGPPPTGTARTLFERDVYPIMSSQCGAGCHLVGSSSSTPFVTPSVSGAYEQITGFDSVVGNYTEAGSPVYTKIVPGPHNARSYDASQTAKVLAWLAAEVESRDVTDPTDPPPTETAGQASARLIAEWRGCLQLQDFIDLRFGEVWANKGTNEGNCENCHSTGAYGMIATDDNETMYNVLTQNKNYMLFFFTPDVTDLSNAMIVTNGEHFVTLGQRIPPHQEHPAFNPNDITPNVGTSPLGALEELYTRTMAHMTAVPSECGPPITD